MAAGLNLFKLHGLSLKRRHLYLTMYSRILFKGKHTMKTLIPLIYLVIGVFVFVLAADFVEVQVEGISKAVERSIPKG